MSMNSDIIEKKLMCKLPNDYAEFVNKHGYCILNDKEIFAYDKTIEDIDSLPCVIGATNIFRNMNLITNEDIAISQEDEYIVGIHLNTGEVFYSCMDGTRKVVASDFKTWINTNE